MTRSRMLAFILSMVAQLIALPVQSRNSAVLATTNLCYQAAEEASRKTGVPLKVLMALTLTETGRTQDGQVQAWPWALNEGGKSHWFATRDEALTYLSDALAVGVSNIDVGCFQLNHRWHGSAFASLEEMMDPVENALYAARLVGRLAGDSEDWVAAAGAYHSGTPEVAERYLARFEPIYAALEGQRVSDVTTRTPVRTNAFPLFQGGGVRSAGSIVPLVSTARPLIGGP